MKFYLTVPCVYLSRLPIRTAQQVLDYTHKLIDYEKGVGIQNNLLMTGSSLKHDFPGFQAIKDGKTTNIKLYIR